jgi:hypothetical protein
MGQLQHLRQMGEDQKRLHMRRVTAILGTLARIEQEGHLSLTLELAKAHAMIEYNRYAEQGIYGF